MRKIPCSYVNITPYVIASPYGVDSPIKDLQLHLNSIEWLEKSFNRAMLMTRLDDNGNKDQFPKGWVNENIDEINLIGLDNFNSYSFFYSRDSENVIDYSEGIDNRFERQVSLYCWFNSESLGRTEIDVMPEYINDFINAINTVVFTGASKIQINGIDENPNNVFSDFTLNIDSLQIINHPYRAFRIDMNIYYYYTYC